LDKHLKIRKAMTSIINLHVKPHITSVGGYRGRFVSPSNNFKATDDI